MLTKELLIRQQNNYDCTEWKQKVQEVLDLNPGEIIEVIPEKYLDELMTRGSMAAQQAILPHLKHLFGLPETPIEYLDDNCVFKYNDLEGIVWFHKDIKHNLTNCYGMSNETMLDFLKSWARNNLGISKTTEFPNRKDRRYKIKNDLTKDYLGLVVLIAADKDWFN